MSRCRRTDALLDATIAGVGLTGEQSNHATRCTECARALASARRFEAELAGIALELSPEPMPAPADLTAALAAGITGGRLMTLRHTFIGAAVVGGVVVLVAGISLLAPLLAAPGSSARPPERLNAWLDAALVQALEVDGRRADPAEWQAYQVELCGSRAIAFFTERDPSGVRPFRWAIGEPNDGQEVTATGISGTLFEADVARARAAMPVCSIFVDPSLGDQAANDALEEAWTRQRKEMEAQGFPRGPIPNFRQLDLRDARVVDMTPISRDTYRALVEVPDGARTQPWRQCESLPRH